jgi:hypothetical protein
MNINFFHRHADGTLKSNDEYFEILVNTINQTHTTLNYLNNTIPVIIKELNKKENTLENYQKNYQRIFKKVQTTLIHVQELQKSFIYFMPPTTHKSA